MVKPARVTEPYLEPYTSEERDGPSATKMEVWSGYLKFKWLLIVITLVKRDDEWNTVQGRLDGRQR
jgi:hypothetical protein